MHTPSTTAADKHCSSVAEHCSTGISSSCMKLLSDEGKGRESKNFYHQRSGIE